MILLNGIKISIQQKQTETKENSITNQNKTKNSFFIISQTEKKTALTCSKPLNKSLKHLKLTHTNHKEIRKKK